MDKIGILALLSLAGWVFGYGCYSHDQLEKHPVWTVGKFEDAEGGSRSCDGPQVNFTYLADGMWKEARQCERSLAYSVIRSERFHGVCFPVLYRKGLMDIHIMLITPQDFRRHHYPFPDSLKWVLPWLMDSASVYNP